MGKRGPAPKPTALKILSGNPGHRPLNDAEPQPTRGRPPCPAWLDPAAKTLWRRLVPELHTLGLLTVVDGNTLAAYCQAWAEFQWATETLASEGRVVTAGEKGYRMPHPAVAMQRTAWKAVKDFAALFGLDPSSRSRLRVEKPDKPADDPMDAFLSRGKRKA